MIGSIDLQLFTVFYNITHMYIGRTAALGVAS